MTGERWILEHLIALINGGRNAEDNLCLTCPFCLPAKNADDLAIKSKTAAVQQKHILPRPPSRMRGQGFQKREPQRTATSPIVRKSDLNR
jgi:5-methylcytosine-specific restriction enzyme A